MATDEERDDVRLSSLDSPLGDGLEVTKRDLVDHLDAFADRLVPLLADRPLTVKRVRPGAEPFIQRDVPKGAPEWLRTVATWSDRARREVHQVLVEDRRTLLCVRPGDVTVRTAAGRFGVADPWAAAMPEAQELPADLIAEGHGIPVARVQALHEGKRRARARATEEKSPT